MNYLIALLTLIIFIGLYIGAYYLNSKIDRPKTCKELKCEGCKLNCDKRGEYNE